jgi:hypothetical protein
MTRLWAGRCGVQIPAGRMELSFLQNAHPEGVVHLVSYLMGIRVISLGSKVAGV